MIAFDNRPIWVQRERTKRPIFRTDTYADVPGPLSAPLTRFATNRELMYTQFFQLSDTPFKNTPDPRFFFATDEREEALASMWYTVMQRRGVMLLTGDGGVGKSMLVRMLAGRLKSNAVFAEIGTPRSAGVDFLHSICADLNIDMPANAPQAHIQRVVVDYLSEQAATGKPVVIIADTADDLSDHALRFVSQLADLDASTSKLVQILLVGGESLRQRMHQPQFAALRQRLSRVCRLTPFDARQTCAYIQHRLKLCGNKKADLFSPDALNTAHEHTRGIARLINTLCDNALLSAMADDAKVVEAKHIKSAAKMFDCGPMDASSENQPSLRSVASSVAHQPININVTPDLSALGQQISALKAITDELQQSATPSTADHVGVIAQRLDSMQDELRAVPDNRVTQGSEVREMTTRLSNIERLIEKHLQQAVKNAPAESPQIHSRLESIEERMKAFSQDVHDRSHRLADTLTTLQDNVEPPAPPQPVAPPKTTLEAEVTVVQYEPPPIAQSESTDPDEYEPVHELTAAEIIKHRRMERQKRSHQTTVNRSAAAHLLETVTELDSLIVEMCRREPN